MKLTMLVAAVVDDKPVAAGQEVDVDEETANALRADGKAALPYEPPKEGNYSARTGRQGTDSPPPPRAAQSSTGTESVNSGGAEEKQKR